MSLLRKNRQGEGPLRPDLRPHRRRCYPLSRRLSNDFGQPLRGENTCRLHVPAISCVNTGTYGDGNAISSFVFLTVDGPKLTELHSDGDVDGDGPLSGRAPRSQAVSHEVAAIGRHLSLPGNPSAALRPSWREVLPAFGRQLMVPEASKVLSQSEVLFVVALVSGLKFLEIRSDIASYGGQEAAQTNRVHRAVSV
jgi:hypothetical protein